MTSFAVLAFSFFVFNRFLFFRFSFVFGFHHFFVFVLVFVNEFVIFSVFTIFVFVFVNENHTDRHWRGTTRSRLETDRPRVRVIVSVDLVLQDVVDIYTN